MTFLCIQFSYRKTLQTNMFWVKEQSKCIYFSREKLWFASTQDGLKKLVILNATVHGCGCFRMYKFSKGNGQSMFVSNGDLFTEEDLDFKFIRSIRKEKCSIPSPEPRAITKIDYAPLLVTFFMIVAGSSVLICIILLFICCKLYCCLRRSKKGEKQVELQRL